MLGLPLTVPSVFPANTIQTQRMLMKLYLDKDTVNLEKATFGMSFC